MNSIKASDWPSSSSPPPPPNPNDVTNEKSSIDHSFTDKLQKVPPIVTDQRQTTPTYHCDTCNLNFVNELENWAHNRSAHPKTTSTSSFTSGRGNGLASGGASLTPPSVDGQSSTASPMAMKMLTTASSSSSNIVPDTVAAVLTTTTTTTATTSTTANTANTTATTTTANNNTTTTSTATNKIFNLEAYCDICDKEVCNKYFLKTHKANKHGVFDTGETIPTNRERSTAGFLRRSFLPYRQEMSTCGRFLSPFHVPTTSSSSSSSSPPPPPPPTLLPPPSSSSSYDQTTAAIFDLLLQTSSSSFNDKTQSIGHLTINDQTDPNLATIHDNPSTETKIPETQSPRDLGALLASAYSALLQQQQQQTSNPSADKDCFDNFDSTAYANILKSLPPTNFWPLNATLSSTVSDQVNFLQIATAVAAAAAAASSTSAIPKLENVSPNADSRIDINTKPIAQQTSLISSNLTGGFGTESYCFLCCKAFCNKYFLKTHVLKKHGNVADLAMLQSRDFAASPTGQRSISRKRRTLDVVAVQSSSSSSPSPNNATVFSETVVPKKLKSGHDDSGFILSDKKSTDDKDLVLNLSSNHNNNNNNNHHHQQQQQLHQDEKSYDKVMKLEIDEYSYHNACKASRSETYQNGIVAQNIQAQFDESIDPQVYCEICRKPFCTKYFLKIHMLKIHGINLETSPASSETTAQRNIINSTYQNPNNSVSLASAFELIDNATKQNTFSSLNNVTQENQESCDLADHNSIDKSISKKSTSPKMVSMTNVGKNFCEICNKELCNKYFLRTHMLKMHGVVIDDNQTVIGNINSMMINKSADGSLYRCDFCGKELVSKQQLKVHVQIVHQSTASIGDLPPTLNLAGSTDEDDDYDGTNSQTDVRDDSSSSNNNNNNNTNNLLSSCSPPIQRPLSLIANCNNGSGGPPTDSSSEGDLTSSNDGQPYDLTSGIINDGLQCEFCPQRCSNAVSLQMHVIGIHQREVRANVEKAALNALGIDFQQKQQQQQQQQQICLNNADVSKDTKGKHSGQSTASSATVEATIDDVASRGTTNFQNEIMSALFNGTIPFTYRDESTLSSESTVAPKNYKCSYCNYSTRWISNLSTHEKRHNLTTLGIPPGTNGNDRPFVCRICLRAYRYAHSLQRHMEGHRMSTFGLQMQMIAAGNFAPFSSSSSSPTTNLSKIVPFLNYSAPPAVDVLSTPAQSDLATSLATVATINTDALENVQRHRINSGDDDGEENGNCDQNFAANFPLRRRFEFRRNYVMRTPRRRWTCRLCNNGKIFGNESVFKRHRLIFHVKKETKLDVINSTIKTISHKWYKCKICGLKAKRLVLIKRHLADEHASIYVKKMIENYTSDQIQSIFTKPSQRLSQIENQNVEHQSTFVMRPFFVRPAVDQTLDQQEENVNPLNYSQCFAPGVVFLPVLENIDLVGDEKQSIESFEVKFLLVPLPADKIKNGFSPLTALSASCERSTNSQSD